MRSKTEGSGRRRPRQRNFPGRRLAALVAALVAAAALAAGCSSSGSSGSSAAAPASAASSAAPSAAPAAIKGPVAPAKEVGITATTIKVGLIADVNNPVAPGVFQKSVNAMDAWANIVNASGGLAGRKVVVDFCDGKIDANATTNCVIKACANDFALVGTAANALEDISDLDGCKNADGKAVGIPNLAAFAFPPLSCDKDTYLTAGLGSYCATQKANPQTYTVNIGDFRYFTSQFKDLHGIFIYDDDVPTLKFTQVPEFKAGSNLGLKLDGQGFYPASAESPQSALTPFIQVIKSNQSNFTYVDTTLPNMVSMRREAQLQGVNSSVKVWECSSTCYSPSFYQEGGAAVNGTYSPLLDLPYMTDYKANSALDRLVTALGGTANLDNDALNSYVMGLLFQDAVTKIVASHATLNRAALFTELNQEHSFTADGIIGPTDVAGRAPSACIVVTQLVNGNWQRVYPAKAGTFDCASDNITTIKMNLNG